MASAKYSIILIEFLVKSLVSEEQLVGFVKGQIFWSVESVMSNYARDPIEMHKAFSDVLVCGAVVEKGIVFDDVEVNFVLGMLF